MNSGTFRVRFYVEPWRSDSLWSSKKVACCGIVWQVQATIDPARIVRDQNVHCPTFLSTYLVACKTTDEVSDPSQLRNWEAEIEGAITIMNLKYSARNLTHEFSHTFSMEHPRFVSENECNCRYCTDEQEYCMLDANNCITIEVRISVKDAIGFTVPPILDFTVPNDHTDVVFLIEERKIYANKEELFTYVPDLGHMFDKGETQVVFDDVNYEDFVNFLSVIYPSQAPISDINFKQLLELAKKFSLQYLTDTIEEHWLIDDHYFPPTEGLILIVKYGLTKYRDWVNSERRSWDDKPNVSVILEMPEYKAMSDKEARELFEAVV